MIPLSLYIHIPWCEKKCPYCDFNSHQATSTVNEPAYIAAVLFDLSNDIKHFKHALGDRAIQSIFIGGGTPSLFSAQSINALLKGVKQQIPVTNDIEITLEANPGSSEIAKFSAFRQAGVNRLSIGVQSFNNRKLRDLGRVHTGEQALNAAHSVRAAGFDNFNLDLMFGLPSQSITESLDDLQQAIELSPPHLSCYQLTIEPNTLFHHHPPIRPDDETLWEMQTQWQSLLAQYQYQQYEVSAYAKAEHRCRHNTNYWRFGDYLGIGAGAHGKITDQDGAVHRNWKIKHPATYINAANDRQSFNGGAHQVDTEQLPFEFMLNALRLTDGIGLDLFTERTGLSIDTISAILDQHQQKELISINNQTITPSKRGRQMLDSLLQDYLNRR